MDLVRLRIRKRKNSKTNPCVTRKPLILVLFGITQETGIFFRNTDVRQKCAKLTLGKWAGMCANKAVYGVNVNVPVGHTGRYYSSFRESGKWSFVWQLSCRVHH